MKTEAEAREYVSCLVSDPAQMDRLDALVDALEAENEKQNLIAKATLDTVWVRHIADSAQLLDLNSAVSGPCLDLGSGPGFPGLVLAILRPEMHFHLVESRKRRVQWLHTASTHLGLENCTIHGMRLEKVDTFAAGSITARAFAPLDRLLELSARFSTGGTVWLLPKGRSAQQEVAGLSRRRRKMFHVEQSWTDRSAGIIVGKGRIEAKR